MLRILALLSYLALLLAPVGPAQANAGCAMAPEVAVHGVMLSSAMVVDHASAMPPHHAPGESCKQFCAVIAILAPAPPAVLQSVVTGLPSRPAASLADSLPPAPSDRPPKPLV